MDKHDTLLVGGGSLESRKIIRSILEENYNLLEAGNARQMLLLLEQNIDCIATVILDLTCPEVIDLNVITGKYALSLLSRIPVIVMTAKEEADCLDRYFSMGASDVIPLDYDPYAMLRRIETIVQLHLHRQNLEQMVQEQAAVLRHSNDVMVDALSSIIEYRSVESGQHILRIRHFTKVLLKKVASACPEYGLTDGIISIISSAAALHDVGKIGIPDAILTKPGPLTPQEWETMKTHTLIGCRILESLGAMGNEEYLRYAHNICHYHHERWDGGGYPEGLEGENIPICAQVVGLADVYDALTTKRVYKEAFDLKASANMIINGECGIFSPKLLECFKQVIPEFEKLSQAYADGMSPKADSFCVELPPPAAPEETDSLQFNQHKFQCLLHYVNAFVLELAVDRGYYHLRYNPYPELAIVNQANSFEELKQIVLDHLVAPEDRDRMAHLMDTGIDEYLQAGMRRQSFTFSLRSGENQTQLYDVTLLRANVSQRENRSMAVLCRKIENAPAAQEAGLPEDLFLCQNISDAFCCRNDHDFTLIRMSQQTHTIAGYTLQEIRSSFGGSFLALLHPDDRETVGRSFREQLKEGNSAQAEFRVRYKNGQLLWMLGKCRLILSEEGLEYLVVQLTDLSQTRQAFDALTEKLARYEIILAQTENALFDWNVQEDTISFSDTWENIFGGTPISRNVRQSLADSTFLHPDDLPLLFDGIQRIENGSSYETLEVRIATTQGRYIWTRFRASALLDDQGKLVRIVGLVINIDAEKQTARALQDRAERDALTKLLNKDSGRKQAEEYLAQFPGGVNCALLIIDLDNFKTVNDRFGHLFGDTVLTRAAKEIRQMFRTQDIVARIGGDEFMVLLRGASSRALVENRCQRLLSVFRTAFQEQGQKLPISCSIGIALAPEHGTSYVELFKRADRALYAAKNRGRDTYVFYSRDADNVVYLGSRGTAISNHIDSDDRPGLADSGIVQYAFQRLYTSQNVDESIGQLLKLIGEQTNVSRVYIFENSADNRFCSNTFEWCNTDIKPEIENLQNVSYETDIPDYDRNFDENGIFYCPDIRNLPQHLYEILAPQGIKSILHCAIRENGIFRGYIGFDDCREYRLWTREQIDLLTYFAEMMSVFLLKMRAQERMKCRANELHHILDSQNSRLYVVDPTSWNLKYVNEKIRRSLPDLQLESPCYKSLTGRDAPCPGCPMAALQGQNQASFLRRAPGQAQAVLAEAIQIQWEELPACMLTWREIPEETP